MIVYEKVNVGLTLVRDDTTGAAIGSICSEANANGYYWKLYGSLESRGLTQHIETAKHNIEVEWSKLCSSSPAKKQQAPE